MADLAVRGIEIDLRANTLRLDFGAPREGRSTDPESWQPASIDIGVGGRLLGVDLNGQYVPVMEPEPGTEALVRSASVQVGVVCDGGSKRIASIIIPRKGEGYEITFPSGNQ